MRTSNTTALCAEVGWPMVVHKFDEVRMKLQLDELPNPARVAFAAACAERLRPSYLDFAAPTGRGDPRAFVATLDRLWRDLDGESMSNDDVSAMIDVSMSLIPHEDDGDWLDAQAYAEDASSALAYAMQCRLTGDSQEAAWAARRAYEAIDQYLLRQLNSNVITAAAQSQILSHPLVQAELARQRADLEDLRAQPSGSLRASIARVRARATIDSNRVFK